LEGVTGVLAIEEPFGSSFTVLAICMSVSCLGFLPFNVPKAKDRENLTRPHRRHLYQLLANERGISQWKIAAGYGLFQLIVGMSILILKPFGDIMVLLLIAVYFGAFIIVSYSVRRKVNGSRT